MIDVWPRKQHLIEKNGGGGPRGPVAKAVTGHRLEAGRHPLPSLGSMPVSEEFAVAGGDAICGSSTGTKNRPTVGSIVFGAVGGLGVSARFCRVSAAFAATSLAIDSFKYDFPAALVVIH
jgi:hypothetical protein